jgi:hypothetical protein
MACHPSADPRRCPVKHAYHKFAGIGSSLNRPVGRPPFQARRHYARFGYQAQSRKKPSLGGCGRAASGIRSVRARLHRYQAGARARDLACNNQRAPAEPWTEQQKGAIERG